LPWPICGVNDTYAQLAAGFGVGIATAYRYVRKAIDILAVLAPLAQRGTREGLFEGVRDPGRHRAEFDATGAPVQYPTVKQNWPACASASSVATRGDLIFA
jgi:hypothetical protein